VVGWWREMCTGHEDKDIGSSSPVYNRTNPIELIQGQRSKSLGFPAFSGAAATRGQYIALSKA